MSGGRPLKCRARQGLICQAYLSGVLQVGHKSLLQNSGGQFAESW